MTRRIPLIPTIIVLAAVATMIALGIWQLGRAKEKTALIARYEAAGSAAPAAYPRTEAETENALYRTSTVVCDRVTDMSTIASRSASGVSGLAQVATCAIDGGGEAKVLLGFTRKPELAEWSGGEVTGIVAPGPRLVADPPLAGLSPLAKPDPADIPNNHMAYVGQWFFFALTALVIYALALRKRWQASEA